MSRSAVHARPGQDRTSLYEDITNKIIAELEAGRLPWVQPWGSSGVSAPLAMPKNAATGRGYSGINVLILWGAVVQHGFPTQSWLTFRQALGLGGNVRKGERGTTVVYADRFVPDDERRRSRETGDEAVAIPFLKRFTVFNAAQCDGLPDDLVAVPPPVPEGLIMPEVEALIRASGADLRLGGDKAFYAPAHDYIQLPRPESYFEPINWHRTALHELGHWTGHASRLARDLSGAFGSKPYSREELVAEMTSAFLLRDARHRPDRPSRRLYRRLARGAAGRQPRRHPRRERRFEGRGLSARLPNRRGRRADRIGGSSMMGATANPDMRKAAASPRREYEDESAIAWSKIRCKDLPTDSRFGRENVPFLGYRCWVGVRPNQPLRIPVIAVLLCRHLKRKFTMVDRRVGLDVGVRPRTAYPT